MHLSNLVTVNPVFIRTAGQLWDFFPIVVINSHFAADVDSFTLLFRSTVDF